jgi:predicted  nucleic acid-binding Zn-ribbon protein
VSGLDRLLEVQEHDTHADQLRHRRATLEERTTVERARTDVERASALAADLDQRRQDLRREQRRLEDEVAAYEDKASGADTALYGGAVTNPRELQALQDEVSSLRRRIRQLEDRVIELMEQLEPLDAEGDRLSTERADADRRLTAGTATLRTAEADIDAELERVLAAREKAASTVPEPLLAEYEQLRSRLRGVGVSRLTNGQCGGCHLRLSAVELDRIRKGPPDAIVHCEECGRLLVP